MSSTTLYGEQVYPPLTERHPELDFLSDDWQKIRIQEEWGWIEVEYASCTGRRLVTHEQYQGLNDLFLRLRADHRRERELTAERLVRSLQIRRRSEAERNWPQ